MLTVKILNLRQDENNHADYVVHINTTLERLDYFLIKGFDRARGWRELLTEVVKKVEQGATGANRRIILTAFGDRLRSEPMEWPTNLPPDIYLPWPLDSAHLFNRVGKEVLPNNPTMRHVKFKANGLFVWHNGESCRKYVLVDIGPPALPIPKRREP